MADTFRKLMWCVTHEEPAWRYSDGSEACWYDSIVEARCNHSLVDLPLTVLASDDMQGIKRWIRTVDAYFKEYGWESYLLLEERRRLPQHIIDWVMDDPGVPRSTSV